MTGGVLAWGSPHGSNSPRRKASSETHEHKGDFKGFESAPRFPSSATALDVAQHVFYVFLPKTHRAAVFADA